MKFREFQKISLEALTFNSYLEMFFMLLMATRGYTYNIIGTYDRQTEILDVLLQDLFWVWFFDHLSFAGCKETLQAGHTHLNIQSI